MKLAGRQQRAGWQDGWQEVRQHHLLARLTQQLLAWALPQPGCGSQWRLPLLHKMARQRPLAWQQMAQVAQQPPQQVPRQACCLWAACPGGRAQGPC